jgi:hypothetical protein
MRSDSWRLDSRLFRIAPCGALLAVWPPMYVQYDLRPTRLTVHPPIIDSFKRSSGRCRREWNKEHSLGGGNYGLYSIRPWHND